ncbi:hypothetical protein F2Q70_00021391 [Brassica cretica]|uniref:Uncharacterized protein n=1 Tax=Brassica cretica TaxID=69181 RepID=A0A8S9GRG8_BRACR|nr:hypothetical protein F2Q70_00021391 [Brassica cretica]
MKVETQILENLRILMQYRDTKGGEETKEGSISAIQIKTLTSGLKPDHQRERMNLELHTDGRELAVVGCELNGTGRVCFLSGSRAASYRVRELLPIGFASG